MAAAGLSLPPFGAILGRKSTQTTARYAHLVDKAQQKTPRVIGEAIEQCTSEGAERLREQRAMGDELGEAETEMVSIDSKVIRSRVRDGADLRPRLLGQRNRPLASFAPVAEPATRA